jgi:anti-sigma regulatory factor (Ser/Thr protein kinase)
MEKNNTISFKIPQTLSQIDDARKKILNYLLKNKINIECISQIELVVYEVLVNVIEHGEKKYKDEEIKLTCKINSKNIEVIIQSIGSMFDITKSQLPDIEEHVKSGVNHGLGIYMIRTLMNSIEYSFNDKISENKIVMIKNL